MSEAVNHDTCKAVLTAEGDVSFLSGEHSEGLFGVNRHVEVLKQLCAASFFFGDADIHHFVDPIMADFVLFAVKGNHIIILVVPA